MNANSFRWSVVGIAILIAFAALLPTIYDAMDGALDGDIQPANSNVVVDFVATQVKPINLGLDLQGGLLLQYRVMVDQAVEDKLDRMSSDIEKRLLSKEAKGAKAIYVYGDSYITLTFPNEGEAAKLDDSILSFFSSLQKVEISPTEFRLAMDTKYIDETKEYAVTQAVERIRQRVDGLGVAEPAITRQGKGDVVVQLPGLDKKDVERVKKLIGATAQLQFRMVDDAGNNAFFNRFSGKLPKGFQLRNVGGNRSVTHHDKEMLKKYFKGKVPPDHFIGYQKHKVYKDLQKTDEDKDKSYWKSYYVFRKVNLTGDYVQNASVQSNPQTNRPYVALEFDLKGADLFGELSSNNVGKRMAIMLDDEVQSAPVFNEAIMGGRCSITMNSMQSYADVIADSTDLVTALRHGALPAPIEKQFETLVGPSLGQDSIDASTRAFLIGLLLVILLMMVYYRASGVISIIALGLNMMFILTGLAVIGATLTLPGIAGIILTVGMAVDANVIIFERIREELDTGMKPRDAMLAGFEKALSAVIDANITTGIAGLVLLQFGTGPIKGFAVTLLIGIVSTIFTAVFISRMLFESWLSKGNKDTLSI